MAIRIDNLSYRYQRGTPFERVALRDVTLAIEPGSCVGIAGPAGSGKSTLIQHLNGLLKPTAGRVVINGIDVSASNPAQLRREVGIVFQYPEQQLFEETVFREVAFGLSGRGLARGEIEGRVREALAAVGLGEELLDRSPFALSGGQQRRIAIAGALALRPRILALDEPAAGLDPQGRRDILTLLAQLQRESGLTLLLVSHHMDDLARMADRMVLLNHGTLVAQGRTREVFQDGDALARAGLVAPQITRFMAELKKAVPELAECILTVEEARDELKRVLGRRPGRKGRYEVRDDHGTLLPGPFGSAPGRPEDQDLFDPAVGDGCLSS